MSRIGKKTLVLPEKVELTLNGGKLVIKGPKGTLERQVPASVSITVSGKEVTVATQKTELTDELNSLWGTWGAHVQNMLEGTSQGYTKKLIIEGIGYKAEVKGQDIILNLGFSHPVKMPIPATLKVTSDKGIVTIVGSNKEEVGQFAANIRALKKPEPYKGKGIRYDGEVIRRKQGKKTA
jgi:large subunit ribosomal protein L6